MNIKGLVSVMALALVCMPSAFAQRCGNSNIPDWKTCHVGGGSPSKSTRSTSSSSTNGNYSKNNSYSYSTAPSNVTSGIYGRQAVSGYASHSGMIIRKAEIRTCPVSACTVIGYYQKGIKVDWSVVNNGFVNVYDTVNWVKIADIKATK